jgi:hypothetical protein
MGRLIGATLLFAVAEAVFGRFGVVGLAGAVERSDSTFLFWYLDGPQRNRNRH